MRRLAIPASARVEGGLVRGAGRVVYVYDVATEERCLELAAALERSPKEKLVKALQGLLLPKPAFIASRLEGAMKGWGTEEKVLIRLLAGLDGVLATATMGTRLYVTGSESFIGEVIARAAGFGVVPQGL